MPAASESNRYSPVSFVWVVLVAPVSLLVIVTSALLPILACDLSVIVPCKLALAVACPNMLAVPSRTKQLMTAIHNHRLLFILFSSENLGVFAFQALAANAFCKSFLKRSEERRVGKECRS